MRSTSCVPGSYALGYGGEDMKTERKLLLANLNGSAAFPTPDAAERHKEKYAKLRHQAKAAQPEE